MRKVLILGLLEAKVLSTSRYFAVTEVTQQFFAKSLPQQHIQGTQTTLWLKT
jgi:hypothetical protein